MACGRFSSLPEIVPMATKLKGRLKGLCRFAVDQALVQLNSPASYLPKPKPDTYFHSLVTA